MSLPFPSLFRVTVISGCDVSKRGSHVFSSQGQGAVKVTVRSSYNYIHERSNKIKNINDNGNVISREDINVNNNDIAETNLIDKYYSYKKNKTTFNKNINDKMSKEISWRFVENNTKAGPEMTSTSAIISSNKHHQKYLKHIKKEGSGLLKETKNNIKFKITKNNNDVFRSAFILEYSSEFYKYFFYFSKPLIYIFI